ncbi:MAG: tRNA (adenosine(37)-N6)-threonylcarbamoyltransferase complex ATPase subunit type 1 TsaE [Bacteroidota bacterium]
MQTQQITYSLATLGDAARALWAIGKDVSVWSFAGEMGAGKTTLISALCDYLGVQDAVSSPTYALVNEYQLEQDGKTLSIFHADWYRLKDAEDALYAGMEEILYQPNAYAFVEWASNAIELLHKPYLKIEIEVTGDEERLMTVSIV